MGTNSLLISVAGLPRILSDFIPDNGLALLASSLKSAGHNVKILDFNLPDVLFQIFAFKSLKELRFLGEKFFLDKKRPSFSDIVRMKMLSRRLEAIKDRVFDAIIFSIVKEVRSGGVDFVGLKLWGGDGFTYSLKLAAHLKKNCRGVKVFGGGPQVDIFGEKIFKVSGDFDALCYGEGEESIVQLADYVRGKTRLQEIPNLLFKSGGGAVRTRRKYLDDLNDLPYPVYDEAVYEGIKTKLNLIVLDESRGCPNACYFCIHPLKSGKRRGKTPERVVRELKYCTEKYGTRLFRYAGSNTPGALLEGAARLLKAEGGGIGYAAFGHFTELLTADFKLLKESGCLSLFFGVESGDEKILQGVMNKNVRSAEMEKVLAECRAAGIFTVVSIIHPAPFETPASRATTLNFLKRTRPDSVLVQFPGIYPGTTWAKKPDLFNFKFAAGDYALNVMNYQINSLFPPRYWKPLPYRVNGMKFARFAKETERFQKDVQDAGISTFVSDEAFLLSRYAGFSSLEEFVDRNRFYFFAGRAEELKKEIETINRNSSLNQV